MKVVRQILISTAIGPIAMINIINLVFVDIHAGPYSSQLQLLISLTRTTEYQKMPVFPLII